MAGDLTLDAMPTNPTILGFSNRWQAPALPHALERRLRERDLADAEDWL